MGGDDAVLVSGQPPLQSAKRGELCGPLVQRDGGLTTGVAILDTDQTIRKVGLRSSVIVNRGPDRRLVFDDELFGGEQSVQHIGESGFGETITVAQHPQALTKNNVVEKERFIPIFGRCETTLDAASTTLPTRQTTKAP